MAVRHGESTESVRAESFLKTRVHALMMRARNEIVRASYFYIYDAHRTADERYENLYPTSE